MIVTTGRIIKVDSSDYHFEKSSEAPGLVIASAARTRTGIIELPGNAVEAEAFCAAYMRIVREDVGYRKSEYESAPPESREVR